MKASTSLVFSSLVLATLTTSCNENTSRSSGVTTNFAVTGSAQDAVAQTNLQKAFSLIVPTAVALEPGLLEDSNGDAINLDEAWIALKKIQFKANEVASAGESGDHSAHYHGPFYINLLSNDPISFGQITMPESGLRRVKMLLHKGNDGAAPAQLNGRSMYLAGTINSFNFTFAADVTTDFEVSGPNVIVPEEGKHLMMVIRMADLFKNINLSAITSNVNISAATPVSTNNNPCPAYQVNAPDLYTCFKKGLNKEAKFGKDNGDKDLDASDEMVNE